MEGHDPAVLQPFLEEIQEIMAFEDLFAMNEETKRICRRWDRFCHDLFDAYLDNSLAEMETGSADSDLHKDEALAA